MTQAKPLPIALIQLQPQASCDENLVQARAACEFAAAEGAELIVLPEYFADLFGADADPRDPAHAPHALGEGPVCEFLATLAEQLDVTIHGGSFLESANGKVFNTTPVYGPDGALRAVYRKMHPFACPAVPPGSGNAEADFIEAGDEPVAYNVGSFRVGCSTCWDIRFPQLFARYRELGCSLVVCPAAFFAGAPTNILFWDALLRGRAVDGGFYVASATVVGPMPEPADASMPHRNPVTFHGVTRLIDPMGRVLASGSDTQADRLSGTLEPERLATAAANFPL